MQQPCPTSKVQPTQRKAKQLALHHVTPVCKDRLTEEVWWMIKWPKPVEAEATMIWSTFWSKNLSNKSEIWSLSSKNTTLYFRSIKTCSSSLDNRSRNINGQLFFSPSSWMIFCTRSPTFCNPTKICISMSRRSRRRGWKICRRKTRWRLCLSF